MLDVAVDGVCTGFGAGGGSPRAGDKAGDVADCGAGLFDEAESLFEVALSLAREADDEVGAEREPREARVEQGGETAEVFGGMLAVHREQYAVAAALDRDVDELVEPFVGKAVQECFQVRRHMARIAHAESDLVVPGDLCEDFLDEFGEVCADVKAVAGAVLPGELDFVAAVVYKGVDLFDDKFGRKAVQAPLHEARAAEGAGVHAAFFDVHDAGKRRFSQGACADLLAGVVPV